MAISLLLLLVTAVFAQEDCPNPATECPDNCEGAQCGRFLNAQCRLNPCHGLCTPNFFRRGRNVTERCPVRRCSERVCPGARQCVEEIEPLSCPESRPQAFCRQYINTKCVLPPLPANCSQIVCGEGEFCRKRRRGEGVMCVRARNCDRLVCNGGSVCTQTEKGPRCVKSVALSCEELRCPEGTLCVSQSIPSRNLTAAQCLDQEEAKKLPTTETYFCGSGATICSNQEAEICVDVFDSGNYLIPVCIDIGCNVSSDSTCEHSDTAGRRCLALPEGLEAPSMTACLGPTTMIGTTPCMESTEMCPGGMVCREGYFEDNFLFTTCGIPAPTFTGPSCGELECPDPLACNEVAIIEGIGGIARCGGPVFTDETEGSIRSLLDMIRK